MSRHSVLLAALLMGGCAEAVQSQLRAPDGPSPGNASPSPGVEPMQMPMSDAGMGAVIPPDQSPTTVALPITSSAQCGDLVCPTTHPHLVGCTLSPAGFSELCVVRHASFVHFQDGPVCDPRSSGSMTGTITCGLTAPAAPPACDMGGTAAALVDSVASCPGASVPDQPTNAVCNSTASWPSGSDEDEVLRLTNEARARGANCGSHGSFGPTSPLTMHAALQCAARLHSKDMTDTGNFAHQGLDGRGPGDRALAAGYPNSAVAENIYEGPPTPQEVVSGWLASPGHCRNIMDPRMSEIGVGRQGRMWTQVFGRR